MMCYPTSGYIIFSLKKLKSDGGRGLGAGYEGRGPDNPNTRYEQINNSVITYFEGVPDRRQKLIIITLLSNHTIFIVTFVLYLSNLISALHQFFMFACSLHYFCQPASLTCCFFS